MTWLVSGLALLYVAALPLGRTDLPLHAQWGDLLFPLLLLAAWRSSRLVRPWLRPGDWPLAAYLAMTLLAALVSAEPLLGFAQLLKQIYVASVFFLWRRLSQDGVLRDRSQRVFVAAMAIITGLSIMTVFLRLPPAGSAAFFGARDVLPHFGRVWRLRGALLTPEMLGNMLLVAFVLSLSFRAAAQGARRHAWTAVAALLFAGEVLTVSHSVAGFMVATAVFTWAAGTPRTLRAAVGTAAVLSFLMVNAASVLDTGSEQHDYGVAPLSFNVIGVGVEGQLDHYAALKQVGFGAFVAHPWTGIGPGRFPRATEQAYQEGRLTARYREKPPQSDLVGRLAETGLFGGASLLALWASWLRVLWRRLGGATPAERAAAAAVIGLLINSINADVMNFRFLWLALAWALPDEAPGPQA